jgi:hypothetical protein
MRKWKFIIALASLIIISGCSNRDLINNNAKIISSNDIKKLNNILRATLDTMTINIDPYYGKDTYSNLPDNMRMELQNEIIKQGYPLRADSAYYLGLRDAINNLKNGNLVYKTYGLERIIQIDDNQNQWEKDKVYRYILLHEYAIKTEVIAGDVVNSSLKAYEDGYSKIFVPVINIFYGYDVFQKANEDILDVIINQGNSHKEWIYSNK